MTLSTDCVERAGPEVSRVGPEGERWEAWQSCLDQIKWQQGASRSRRGREAKGVPGEDDSAVLAGRRGVVRPGDGRGQAGTWEGSTQGESSPPGPREGGGRGRTDGVCRLW